jgi:flagellar motor switch protein FliG
MARRKDLRGPRKVAAFLMTLDRSAAADVLKRLGDDVVPEVVQALLEIDPKFDPDELRRPLHADVAVALHRPDNLRPGNLRDLEQLLDNSLGKDKSASFLEHVRRRRRLERPFAAVESRPADRIASALREESPAVAALVLAHLDPAQSAAVLACFEAEQAREVVHRMAVLVPPPYDVLLGLAEQLERQITELAPSPTTADTDRRLRTVAEMLSYSTADVEKGVLESIRAADAAIAKGIQEQMFTWEHLADVDRRSMQKILGTVDTRTLSMALKASSPEVEANIVQNLSSRVREMVQEERELAGAVPMSEVLAARDQILATVRAMIESGEFQPAKAGDDLVT